MAVIRHAGVVKVGPPPRPLLRTTNMDATAAGHRELGVPYALRTDAAGNPLPHPLLRFRSGGGTAGNPLLQVPYRDENGILRFKSPATGRRCIPLQGLGLSSRFKYGLYPDINLSVRGLTIDDGAYLPGRDVILGLIGDHMAGKRVCNYYTPDGIGGAHVLRHMGAREEYPFFGTLYHHKDNGSASVHLTDAPSDGFWFHGDPEPFIVQHRWINGPGPIHTPNDPFTPIAWTEDIPLDFRTERQTFLNLKATLSHPEPDKIRLTIRAYVVVLVGKMAEVNWAPALAIEHPLGQGEMDCLTPGLASSGSGNSETCLPGHDIASLQCHCICTGFDLEMCTDLDWSFNGLSNGENEFPACRTENADRFVTEIAVVGSKENYVEKDWPYGTAYTLANLKAAFGIDDGYTLSRWVADQVYRMFSLGLVTISSDAPDRTQGEVSAGVRIFKPAHELPDRLAGTKPLPDTPAQVCFPLSNGTPVLSEIAVLNAKGWERRLAGNFWDDETLADAFSMGRNPQMLNKINQRVWPLMSTKAQGYREVCQRHLEWQNCAALRAMLTNPTTARPATSVTNVPLAVDDFPGGGGFPPGYDPIRRRFVFRLDGPTGVGLFGAPGCQCVEAPTELYCYLALRSGSSLHVNSTHIVPPTWAKFGESECPAGCWKLLCKGGKSRIWRPYYNYGEACLMPDPPAYCQEEPPDEEHICEWIYDEDEWHTGPEFPRFWASAPWVLAHVTIDGCFVRVETHMFMHVLREIDWWVNEWLPDYPDGQYLSLRSPEDRSPPDITLLEPIEIGRGARVYFPTGYPCTNCDSGLLVRRLWNQMHATGRLLAGCAAITPGRSVFQGNGNTGGIWL